MAKKSEIFRLRIDSDLLKKAQKQAQKEQRTLASLIRYVLAWYVEAKNGSQV